MKTARPFRLLFGFMSPAPLLLALGVCLSLYLTPCEAYPDVNIVNSTPYDVYGQVEYPGCADDSYQVDPYSSWSHYRGSCLITKISAYVKTPDGKIEATPYYSSGTSYSRYAVVVLSQTKKEFVVTRITDAVKTPDGKNMAISDTSSGTSYDAVTPTGEPKQFEVTRRGIVA